jgi:hypothetical protein
VVPIGDEAVVAAPARAGSSSSSSSDEEKKAKKNKTKSRSASRKRASIFGGLLGKKDKAEEKKEDHKVEGESSKTNPEVVKEEAPIVPVTDSMYCRLKVTIHMLTTLSFCHRPGHHPGDPSHWRGAEV